MNDSNKQNPGLDGRDILLFGSLGIGGLWYKYGHIVQVWFHENMVQVVFFGVLVLTVCGYVVVRRFQKKNEEDIARMRRLSRAKPQSKSQDAYFERKPKPHRDFDHE